MAGSGMTTWSVLVVAVLGTGASWRALSSREVSPARRAVLALSRQSAVPDCETEGNERSGPAMGLECWSYGHEGAWRIRTLASAHHALVVEADITAKSVAVEMARAIVGRENGRYGEILLYATVVEPRRRNVPAGEQLVIRTQWTPTGGYNSFEFMRPAPDIQNGARKEE